MWPAPRLDVANAVQSVVQRTHDATYKDWKTVLKIGGYVRGSTDLSLTLTRKWGKLVAYTDSVFAIDSEDRKSVTRRQSCTEIAVYRSSQVNQSAS